ncbi:MAG: NHLP bacteriocin export ABC transporter permease/ATPase subunit [Acidobacteria bacterium]|nr:NHLP bacteriocin export ABC transporter permease/ATPase subunit [Acidobacteriota bacterium]
MPGSSAHTDRPLSAPVLLTDPLTSWQVDEGSADVFLVTIRNGGPAGVRHHLLRVHEGEALFGAVPREDGRGLLAVPTPGSRLRGVPRDEREERSETVGEPGRGSAALRLDGWIKSLSRAIAGDTLPRVFGVLEPNQETLVGDQAQRLLTRDGILWTRLVEGAATFIGDARMPLGPHPWPVAPTAWIEAAAQSRLSTVDTPTHAEAPGAWDAFDRFMAAAIDRAARNVDDARRREGQRLERRARMERHRLDRAFRRLAALGAPGDEADEAVDDPWYLACAAVGHAMGMTLEARTRPGPTGPRDPVAAVALAAGVRSRVVALRGAWWTQDVGPLVARRETDGAPVALLPRPARRYELYDPATGVRTRVTEQVAGTLEPLAWSLYRPFPTRALGVIDLLRFGLHGGRADLLTVLIMGIAVGVLGLMVPIVTGVVFDAIIPGADRPQLLLVTVLLVVTAVGTAGFRLVQSFAMQRLESRMDASVQAAVWDRLLGLPVAFFRDFSSGDLAMRSLSIGAIRRALTGSVISSLLAGVFSVFSFGLLFYYSWSLALVATLITVAMALGTAWLGYLDARCQREVMAASGRLSGLLLQLVNGVGKLRVSATEHRAFAAWAAEFSRRMIAARRGRLIGIGLSVFSSVMPLLAVAAIFWQTVQLLSPEAGSGLSTGAFLAFNAAFVQFQTAALGLSGAAVTILGLVPQYERARPILSAVPEAGTALKDPGELAGHIEVAHVDFRYRADAPLVLRDVSVRIPAGRFIAIVGASGSGKSTLFRLLMGFEKPESGAIYFDQQDQAHLNVEALRRQIGVVLQSGRLLSDSMFQNIVGASSLTMEDAWAAAAMAGLEADIRAMPMGMHTMIAEGGGGLSGGQRQRVMIARAIVRRPRILLFDEATSALDNETQAIVTHSLASLKATRVVIAHRLSTIVNADYIYVMDKGAVVQEGTYQALVAQEGPFAELARRQTL